MCLTRPGRKETPGKRPPRVSFRISAPADLLGLLGVLRIGLRVGARERDVDVRFGEPPRQLGQGEALADVPPAGLHVRASGGLGVGILRLVVDRARAVVLAEHSAQLERRIEAGIGGLGARVEGDAPLGLEALQELHDLDAVLVPVDLAHELLDRRDLLRIRHADLSSSRHHNRRGFFRVQAPLGLPNPPCLYL